MSRYVYAFMYAVYTCMLRVYYKYNYVYTFEATSIFSTSHLYAQNRIKSHHFQKCL